MNMIHKMMKNLERMARSKVTPKKFHRIQKRKEIQRFHKIQKPREQQQKKRFYKIQKLRE